MTDDNTTDLTDSEKLNLILEHLAQLEARTEAQAEDGANVTRPLFERAIAEMVQTREVVIERLERVEKEIRLFGRKMDIFNEELLGLRHGHRELEERVSALEQRPN
jgi:hypothetical protein